MKYFLIALVMLPCMAFAQTNADYERAIARFMQFYNAGQADSMTGMYYQRWGAQKANLWEPGKLSVIKAQYGEMVSYKFSRMNREDDMHMFKIVFSTSTYNVGLKFDKDANEVVLVIDTIPAGAGK